jgi:hypothetical protein
MNNLLLKLNLQLNHLIVKINILAHFLDSIYLFVQKNLLKHLMASLSHKYFHMTTQNSGLIWTLCSLLSQPTFKIIVFHLLFK